jgi:ABC-type amino acid transport substrate-binding protein
VDALQGVEMNDRRRLLVALWTGALIVASSTVTTAQINVNSEIAPTGKLRVGMNAANATSVTRAADGILSGISVDLGNSIAEKRGLAFEPVVYGTAAAYTESFGKGDWDIIVTGRNAFDAKMVDFSADVILIDFLFVAAPGASLPMLVKLIERVPRLGSAETIPRMCSLAGR